MAEQMKTVEIYTDGACSGNPGPGGWGAILNFGARPRSSPPYAQPTNSRMELFADQRQALKEPCVAEVYSDSSYIVNAFRMTGSAGSATAG